MLAQGGMSPMAALRARPLTAPGTSDWTQTSVLSMKYKLADLVGLD
jgi:hypothetical protein